MQSYCEFFHKLAGQKQKPFPFQINFHEDTSKFKILKVPTGLGKTVTVLSDWLLRRPTRRLVYCLPGRTLTRQIAGVAADLVAAADPKPKIKVLELMGGSKDLDHDLSPTDHAIIVGTQDILISRALNRGYLTTPFHWPIDFALLNNDATWVYDEVQLLGDALATSTQLAGFREHYKVFGDCPSVWMSATFDQAWLNTVDFSDIHPSVIKLEQPDRLVEDIDQRLRAKKVLACSPECATPKGCAVFLSQKHKDGTLSLVVANTVRRAQEIWAELKKLGIKNPKLLHSRFRPADRINALDDLLARKEGIVVSTQVIEAGVDIDADLMITDIAPWPSLVQRFGRVNRRGTKPESHIFWVDRPTHSKSKKTDEDLALPYQESEVKASRDTLQLLDSAAPADLPEKYHEPPFRFVLRNSDLCDLFDTTPDLAGNHIDVSRFVRSGEETNLYIAWRNWDLDSAPPPSMKRVVQRELCPVSLSEELKKFLKDTRAWAWNFSDGKWEIVKVARIYPGMKILVHTSAGGYQLAQGWSPESKEPVPLIEVEADTPESSVDDDQRSFGPRQTLEEHTDAVVQEINTLLQSIGEIIGSKYTETLLLAARYHDWGKAHPVFQSTMQGEEIKPGTILAKAHTNRRHSVKWFRHELASAIAMVLAGMDPLAAYLVAAHHGKVRVNVRSMPGEKPGANGRIARGLKDGDQLLACRLGGGIARNSFALNLDVTELGLQSDGSESWTDRVFHIFEELGPFRLAYLEMLLRSADVIASQKAKSTGGQSD